MNQAEAKAKLLNRCQEWLGTRETEINRNPFADIVGSMLYGWNPQGQPWCDVFVDAMFIEAFGYDRACELTYQYSGCNGAACAYSAAYYKNHGAWHTEPQLLDQIFFYAAGGINHTGLVVGISQTTVTTIEGNTSDMVARRSYPIHDATIAGYGRPKWEIFDRAEDTPAEAEEKAGSLLSYTVQKGDTMWSIALKYLGSGTRWKELAAWNGLTEREAGQLRVGQVLRLTQEAAGTVTAEVEEPKEESGERVYTVQKGDSLWAIAEKMYGDGLRYVSIMSANGLTGPTIHPGDRLKIPI